MKGVIFDLDGVLIDSRENMSYAWSKVRLHCNINIAFDRYFAEIGKPFDEILRIIGVPKIHFSDVAKVYNFYAKAQSNKISFYNGVKDTLRLLKKDYVLGIVTSKPKDRTELILNELSFFNFISCPNNSLKGKPSPDQMLYTLDHLKLCPSEAVYIGDMQTDYDCATAAGVKFIHAKYGYGEVKCKLSINKISDLPKLLV